MPSDNSPTPEQMELEKQVRTITGSWFQSDDHYAKQTTAIDRDRQILALIATREQTAKVVALREALKTIPHSTFCELIVTPELGQVCGCQAYAYWKPLHDLFATLTNTENTPMDKQLETNGPWQDPLEQDLMLTLAGACAEAGMDEMPLLLVARMLEFTRKRLAAERQAGARESHKEHLQNWFTDYCRDEPHKLKDVPLSAYYATLNTPEPTTDKS